MRFYSTSQRYVCALIAVVAGSALTSSVSAQAGLQGTWSAERQGTRVALTLFGEGFGIWGRTFDLNALDGPAKTAARPDESTRDTVRLTRQAGDFVLEGTLHQGRSTGQYRFVANQEFAAMLRSATRGADRPLSSERLMAIAFFSDLTLAQAREIAAQELPQHTLPAVVEMIVHNATAEYVREIRALGYERVTPEEIVRLRMHGVTPASIRSLHEREQRNVSLNAVLAVMSRERDTRAETKQKHTRGKE
ncbi:MAG: hypothetical protein V4617_07990 [Gemmatimonadota bacterium]